MTDLDQAHAAMEAAPENDAARLQFYERLADTELFILLGQEAAGDQIVPELFDIEDQRFALVFDREERLAEFTGRVVPYAAIPGRALVQMLGGHGVGLALNLQVAPSEMLIPAEAVDWLVATLLHAPAETEARLSELLAPKGLPDAVVKALDRKLAIAAGMAQTAYLAAAVFEDGARGHVLAYIDAVEGAEKALAAAAGEALTFSGIEAGMLDVMFAKSDDAVVSHLARVGLRFDLPEPEQPHVPSAPGMDPAAPPKLR